MRQANNGLAWDIEAYENCVKKINSNWSWEAQRDAMEVCCLKSGGQWIYNEMGNGAGKCVAPPPGVPAGRRVSVPAGLDDAPTVTPAPRPTVPPGLLDSNAVSVTPTSPQVE